MFFNVFPWMRLNSNHFRVSSFLSLRSFSSNDVIWPFKENGLEHIVSQRSLIAYIAYVIKVWARVWMDQNVKIMFIFGYCITNSSVFGTKRYEKWFVSYAKKWFGSVLPSIYIGFVLALIEPTENRGTDQSQHKNWTRRLKKKIFIQMPPSTKQRTVSTSF